MVLTFSLILRKKNFSTIFFKIDVPIKYSSCYLIGINYISIGINGGCDFSYDAKKGITLFLIEFHIKNYVLFNIINFNLNEIEEMSRLGTLVTKTSNSYISTL